MFESPELFMSVISSIASSAMTSGRRNGQTRTTRTHVIFGDSVNGSPNQHERHHSHSHSDRHHRHQSDSSEHSHGRSRITSTSTTRSDASTCQSDNTDVHNIRLPSGCWRRCPACDSNYYGPGKEAFQRGTLMLILAIVMFVVGATLTGLGYWNIIEGTPTLTGPLCIGLAMLLILVAARYISIARRMRRDHGRHRIMFCEDGIDPSSSVGYFQAEDESTTDSMRNRTPSIPTGADYVPPTYSAAILEDYSTSPPEYNNTESSSPTTDRVVFTIQESENENEDNDTRHSEAGNELPVTTDTPAADNLTVDNVFTEPRSPPPTYTEVVLCIPPSSDQPPDT